MVYQKIINRIAYITNGTLAKIAQNIDRNLLWLTFTGC